MALLSTAIGFGLSAAPPAAAQERESGRSFVLAVGEEQQWESNVRFQRPGGPGDGYARVLGSLTGAITGRTSASITARGDATVYRRFEDLNHTSYELLAALSRRATPRLELGIAGSARTTLAADLTTTAGTVSPDAALFPTAMERSQSGTGSLRYALSPRSRLTVDARYGNTTFDTPSLLGGIEAAVTGALHHRLAEAADLSFGYGAERREFAGAPTVVHRLTGTLGNRWQRWDLRAGAGAVLTPGEERGARVRPDGSLDLGYTGRFAALALGYSHDVTATYGIGRLLESDEARAGVGVGNPGRLMLRVEGAHAWAADPSSSDYRVQTTTANAAVVATMAPVTIEAGGFFRRRMQTTAVESRGMRLTVRLAVAGRSNAPPRRRGDDNEGERR